MSALLRLLASWICATPSETGSCGSWDAAIPDSVCPADTVVVWSIAGPGAGAAAAYDIATKASRVVTARVIANRPRRVRWTRGRGAATTSSPVGTSRSCGRLGARSQATAALMESSIVIIRIGLQGPVVPVFDRTSVRFLARRSDKVETRVEQMFETCVRLP